MTLSHDKSVGTFEETSELPRVSVFFYLINRYVKVATIEFYMVMLENYAIAVSASILRCWDGQEVIGVSFPSLRKPFLNQITSQYGFASKLSNT